MKTSELTGLSLDYWHALAEGLEPERFARDGHGWVRCRGDLAPYDASTSARIAAQVAGRERIALIPFEGEWAAFIQGGRVGSAWDGRRLNVSLDHADARGPTLEVACPRARVLMVYGDEVPDPS